MYTSLLIHFLGLTAAVIQMIRGILALSGSLLIVSSAGEPLPPSDTSSEGAVEVQLCFCNNLALLVVEYKIRVLSQTQQQILAQVFAKLVYLKEAVFYTYNPRSGKFYTRGQVGFDRRNKSPQGRPVSERAAFQQMMTVVTRVMLNLLLEGYYDYLGVTLAEFQLPTSVVPISSSSNCNFYKYLHSLQKSY
ncbi:hypothetical protein DFS33DRAFT_1275932 [Desarmillaria ectypa]|nr:hypothetical protein DFS33DRAFT_1275932 [Desarmillaria ectypa]